LGVAIIVADPAQLMQKLPGGGVLIPNLLTGTLYAFATAIGFALALILFAGIREQLALAKVPEAMKGTPIALLTAGLLAMAFMGFSGVV
jgi:electron transport complex protein RnfA